MTIFPIPLTRTTGLAAVIFVALFLFAPWGWAIAFAFGWSLGGDGAAFRQIATAVRSAWTRAKSGA